MVPWDRCSGHAWLKALSPCWLNHGCEQGTGVLGVLLGHRPFWTPKGNGLEADMDVIPADRSAAACLRYWSFSTNHLGLHGFRMVSLSV